MELVNEVEGREKMIYRLRGNRNCIGVDGAVGEANSHLDRRVDGEDVNRRLDGVVGKAVDNATEDRAIIGNREKENQMALEAITDWTISVNKRCGHVQSTHTLASSTKANEGSRENQQFYKDYVRSKSLWTGLTPRPGDRCRDRQRVMRSMEDEEYVIQRRVSGWNHGAMGVVAWGGERMGESRAIYTEGKWTL